MFCHCCQRCNVLLFPICVILKVFDTRFNSWFDLNLQHVLQMLSAELFRYAVQSKFAYFVPQYIANKIHELPFNPKDSNT